MIPLWSWRDDGDDGECLSRDEIRKTTKMTKIQDCLQLIEEGGEEAVAHATAVLQKAMTFQAKGQLWEGMFKDEQDSKQTLEALMQELTAMENSPTYLEKVAKCVRLQRDLPNLQSRVEAARSNVQKSESDLARNVEAGIKDAQNSLTVRQSKWDSAREQDLQRIADQIKFVDEQIRQGGIQIDRKSVV